MGLGNLNPAGSCCGTCQFATDNFPSTGSGQPPNSSKWNQDAGTWTLSFPGGTVTTGSASAALQCLTANPDGVPVSVSVCIDSNHSGNAHRICVDYQDQNNYKYAEYVWVAYGSGTGGTVNIGERVAGTDTVHATVAVQGQGGSLALSPAGEGTLSTNIFLAQVCFDANNNLTAAGGNGAPTFNYLSYQFGSNNGNAHVALGSGAMASGYILFGEYDAGDPFGTLGAFAAYQYKTSCPICTSTCYAFQGVGHTLSSGATGWAGLGSGGTGRFTPSIGAILDPGVRITGMTCTMTADNDGAVMGIGYGLVGGYGIGAGPNVTLEFGSTPQLSVYGLGPPINGSLGSIPVSAAVGSTHTVEVRYQVGDFLPWTQIHYDGACVASFWDAAQATIIKPGIFCSTNSGTAAFSNYGMYYLSATGLEGAGDLYNCPGYCSCCDINDDDWTQLEVIVPAGFMGGTFYPQKDTIFPSVFPNTPNEGRAQDWCAGGTSSAATYTQLAIANIFIPGGTQPGSLDATSTSATLDWYHPSEGDGSTDTTFTEGSANSSFTVAGVQMFYCNWGVTLTYAFPAAGGNPAFGFTVQYNLNNAFGNCTGVTTLSLYNPTAINYLGLFGFTPPATITVQGIP